MAEELWGPHLVCSFLEAVAGGRAGVCPVPTLGARAAYGPVGQGGEKAGIICIQEERGGQRVGNKSGR